MLIIIATLTLQKLSHNITLVGTSLLCRLHPSGSCEGSSEKLTNFMHFHNSCSQNCDHHVLLIKTAHARKESCHKLSLILLREEGLKHNQN